MFFLKLYGHFAAAIGSCALLYLLAAAFSGGEALPIALGAIAIGGVYTAVRTSYEVNTRLHARISSLERRLHPAESQAA